MMSNTPPSKATRSWDHEPLIGQAGLMTMAFEGRDLAPIGQQFMNRIAADPLDANALMDLATIAQLTGDRESGMVFQRHALAIRQQYRLPGPAGGIRLLVLMGPGDFMANTPFDFLLEGSDVAVDLVYVGPGLPFPPILPDHDAVFIAIAESDENQPLLAQVTTLASTLDTPIINPPEHIAALSRDRVSNVLGSIAGVVMPKSAKVDRIVLEQIGRGQRSLGDSLGDGAYPLIARPADSHAGRGLARIDAPDDIEDYLARNEQEQFFISRFVDFSGPDGQFRKARVVVIDGRPFACHLAISTYWMIHYLNAGMAESAEKRAEEAAFIGSFNQGFATRHAATLNEITKRLGLQYYGLDCAEMPDGDLLIFEADSSMVVHAMDPEDQFPYKKVQMHKVFRAFRQLLVDTATRGPHS